MGYSMFNTNKIGSLKWKYISIYISIFLFLASTVVFPRVFDMTGSYSKYVNALKIICMVYNFLMFIYYFKTRKRMFISIAVCLVLTSFILNVSFINYVLYVLVLFAYGDKERNIKVYVYIKIFLVSIVFICGFYGLNSQHIIDEVGRSTRYTLGFTNPNTASTMIFDIILGIIYMKKCSKKTVFITLSMTLFIHALTDTRTLLFSYVVLIFFLGINKQKMCFLKPILIRMFWIACSITLIILLLHNTHVNIFLNKRPAMMYEFLSYYPINLFGYSKGDLVVSVDNSYLRILIELGLIYFLIHSRLIKNALNQLFYNEDYLGVKIVISILIYDIFEQFTIAHGSILLVFIANYLIDNRVKFKNKIYENNVNKIVN